MARNLSACPGGLNSMAKHVVSIPLITPPLFCIKRYYNGAKLCTQGTLKLKAMKETRGMPLLPLEQRGFPLTQLAMWSKLWRAGRDGTTAGFEHSRTDLQQVAATLSNSYLLSSKLATGTFHENESAMGLLPACCPGLAQRSLGSLRGTPSTPLSPS